MPVVPHINPDKVPPLPPDSLSLMILPPILAFGGFGGLWLVSTALPPLLLLTPSEGVPALVLLRAYRTGYLFCGVLSLLSPLIFTGFILLIFRLMTRRLDPKARREERLTPFMFVPFFLPLFGALIWSALGTDGPLARCDRLEADIQQLQAGETVRMTVFIGGKSAPDPLFTDHPEGWQVTRRAVFGPDTGRGEMVLRFPEALESALDPEGFAMESWESARWYQVSFTSNFCLVAEITPIEG